MLLMLFGNAALFDPRATHTASLSIALCEPCVSSEVPKELQNHAGDCCGVIFDVYYLFK